MGRALTSQDITSDDKVCIARRLFALKVASDDHVKTHKLLREHGFADHDRVAKGASGHA